MWLGLLKQAKDRESIVDCTPVRDTKSGTGCVSNSVPPRRNGRTETENPVTIPADADRIQATCALKIPISGKPEIGAKFPRCNFSRPTTGARRREGPATPAPRPYALRQVLMKVR